MTERADTLVDGASIPFAIAVAIQKPLTGVRAKDAKLSRELNSRALKCRRAVIARVHGHDTNAAATAAPTIKTGAGRRCGFQSDECAARVGRRACAAAIYTCGSACNGSVAVARFGD